MSPWPCIWHKSYPAVGRGGLASRSHGPGGRDVEKDHVAWSRFLSEGSAPDSTRRVMRITRKHFFLPLDLAG